MFCNSQWGISSGDGCHDFLLKTLSYLLIHGAVEDEDEESLQTVEGGEDVGHAHRVLTDVQQAERPCQT